MRDYTAEAEALFRRIADRHRLSFKIDDAAPVEVWWVFPQQQRLSLPITLALQNNDELNFGVGRFWSYFCPFAEVAGDFERAVEAWIAGDARIAQISPWKDALQTRDGDDWQTIYSAGGLLPRLRRRPPLLNSASLSVSGADVRSPPLSDIRVIAASCALGTAAALSTKLSRSTYCPRGPPPRH